jgi:hypothetical protein
MYQARKCHIFAVLTCGASASRAGIVPAKSALRLINICIYVAK